MEENGNYFRGSTEARLDRLENDMKSILENHLPHIQLAINQLALDIERRQEKMNRWLIGILVTLIMTMVGVFINISLGR